MPHGGVPPLAYSALVCCISMIMPHQMCVAAPHLVFVTEHDALLKLYRQTEVGVRTRAGRTPG